MRMIAKGGIKVFDVPGLIESINKFISQIEKLLSQSIKNQELNF